MSDIERMIKHKESLTKPQVNFIFNDCEKIFSQRILNKVNMEYNSILEKVKMVAKASVGYDRIANSKIYEILLKSQEAIVDEFHHESKKNIKEKLNKGFKEEINASNLMLLDDLEVEASINAKNLEQKMLSHFSEDLSDLSTRLSFLLSTNNDEYIDDNNKFNPLGPDVVTQSLAISLHKVIKDNQLHKQAMYFFEAPLANEIRDIYKAINTYLVNKDIIPDIKEYKKYQAKKASELNNFDLNFEPEPIKPQDKIPNKPVNRKTGGDILDNILSDLSSFKAIEEPPTVPTNLYPEKPKNDFSDFDLDVLNKPANIDNNNSSNQPNYWGNSNSFGDMLPELKAASNGNAFAGAPISEDLKVMLNSFAKMVKVLPVINSKFPALTEQQVKYQLLNSDALSHLNSSKTFFNAQVQATKYNLKYINDHNITPKYINVIHKLDQKELQPNAVDQIIIELLGLVFDKIFLQNDLTEHHKYLISKLQFPILKASLSNKDFFVNSENPVRQFLDKLATADSIFNQRYALRFEIIIDEILQKELIDQHIFTESLKQVDKLLADIQKTENNIIEIATDAALNVEKMQKNYDQIINRLDQAIQSSSFPPVRAFIEKVWAPNFVKKWAPWSNLKINDFLASLPPGATSEFNSTIAWFDILIWSTNINQINIESAKKIKQFIPAVAQGLRRICQDVKIDQEDENNLATMLAEKHMVLLKNNPQNEYQALMTKANGIAKLYADKQNKTQVVLNKEFKREIDLADSTFTQDLSVGRWYKFERDGDIFDIKLIWTSPGDTVYIFNNQDKQITLQMTKSQVWQKYKSGSLKLIEGPNFNAQELINQSLEEINRRISIAEKQAKQIMMKQNYAMAGVRK